MFKQYIKQALGMLKENALVNTISILGTAFSIAMIMVVVLIIQIKLAGYSPESERGRMLYVGGTSAKSKDGRMNNNGRMSARVVKDCFYALETPESVTAYFDDDRAVSLPAQRLFKEYKIKYVDPGFWSVFDFSYLYGKAFSEADFHSAIPVAVITDRMASELFGQEDAVGRSILIDYISYRICGVVKSVSQAATDAYGEVWIPYTCNTAVYAHSGNEGISGYYSAIILAKSSTDFEAIRKELTRKIANFNAGQQEHELHFGSNPITRLDIAAGSNGFQKVELQEYLLSTGSLLLFLLLVPALNLTSVIQSSAQKRRSEMGLRKAFGATKGKLVMQILSENMVITLLGGVIGLLLSVALFFIGKSFLLDSETMMNAEMLLRPAWFGAALLFALLLNLLSAALPAFQISRQQIVNALSDK